mmetsp:Transcript_16058/g.19099  ORF Transcript_16058/g.19099 Transcript_16058/m.19099 type:complete len:117 (-) Transcript_16058:47-397(-)
METKQKKTKNGQQEFFPGVSKIKYEGSNSKNLLSFKHYNPKERILGKTMKDWLRFSVCYWHTFRGTGADPFGVGTIKRSWDDGTQSLENALRRVRAAFEVLSNIYIYSVTRAVMVI